MKETNKHLLIATIAALSILLMSARMAYIAYVERVNVVTLKEENKVLQENIEQLKQISFADSVKMLIEQLNIAFPDIAYSQMVVETAHFTSIVFRENNNIAGMRCAHKRPNLQTGVNRGYATYESWQHSVYDFAIWQAYCVKGMNREQYIEYLRTTYAADSTYIDKLNVEK